MIRPHVGPRLTQGSIFSCAQAENYGGCEVHGIVITARCDITHDKANAFNYLPVIRFDDFLHQDFLAMLCEQCKADEDNKFHTFLRNNNLSQSVLIAHSPLQIINTIFPDGSSDRTVSKARPVGLEHVRRLSLLEKALTSIPSDRVVLMVATEYPKIKDRLIKDCIHQKIAGYYFLPAIEPNGAELGYVVLMREVHHIPSRLADLLGGGLEGRDYTELCSRNPSFGGLLELPRDGFAFCGGRIDSPTMEHLMQTFSLLFGRIGLPDPDPAYIASLWSLQPSVKEENT